MFVIVPSAVLRSFVFTVLVCPRGALPACRSFGLEGDMLCQCTLEGVKRWAPFSVEYAEACMRVLQQQEGFSPRLAAILWLTEPAGSEVYHLVHQMRKASSSKASSRQLEQLLGARLQHGISRYVFGGSLQALYALLRYWAPAVQAALERPALLASLGWKRDLFLPAFPERTFFDRSWMVDGGGRLPLFERLALVFSMPDDAGSEQLLSLAELAVQPMSGMRPYFAQRLNAVRWVHCDGDWRGAVQAVLGDPSLLQWLEQHGSDDEEDTVYMTEADFVSEFLTELRTAGIEEQRLSRLEALWGAMGARDKPNEGLAATMHAIRVLHGGGDWSAAVDLALAAPKLLTVRFMHACF